MSKSYGVGSLVVSSLLAISVSISLGSENAPGIIKKKGVEIDLRSQGRIIGDEVATGWKPGQNRRYHPRPGSAGHSPNSASRRQHADEQSRFGQHSGL